MERPSDRRNGGDDGEVEVTRSVRLLLRYCYAMQSAVLHGTRWNGGGGFPGARLTMRAMLHCYDAWAPFRGPCLLSVAFCHVGLGQAERHMNPACMEY